jgi:RimJ/RimL family protein N-acetyltransferase
VTGLNTSTVELRLWSDADLPLLVQVMGDPAMTEHLGGPENDEQIRRRHRRYLDLPSSGGGRMFAIAVASDGDLAGSVGYWERDWRDEVVYEIGWMVVPRFQGRGIAVAAAAAAAAEARAEGRRRFLHAFPSVDNLRSNAICRRLGFSLLEELDFEYPKGHLMRCNDWRRDLLARERRPYTGSKEPPG